MGAPQQNKRPTRRPHSALPGVVLAMLLAVGWPQPPLSAKADERLDAVEAKYNIPIVTSDVQPVVERIHASPCTGWELRRYAGLFAEEFSLYPPAVIRRAGIARVVICRDLALGEQRRAAIPHFGGSTLFLDAVRGIHIPIYLRRVLHHELFHMIDYRDDGDLYSDKEWEALNPKWFHYGHGGVSAQNDPMSSVLSDRYPGFLNSYSKTGVEEDKAEVFSNLMVEPAYVARRCQTDPVLRAKAAAIRRLLKRFCPDVDERFWVRVAAFRALPGMTLP